MKLHTYVGSAHFFFFFFFFLGGGGGGGVKILKFIFLFGILRYFQFLWYWYFLVFYRTLSFGTGTIWYFMVLSGILWCL